MRIVDVSVPVRPGMPVYEGDPEVATAWVTTVAAGDLANVSRWDVGAHSGTHVEAALHLADGVPGVDALPLAAMIGPAWVADATWARTDLGPADLPRLGVPEGTERLLVRTRNSALWDRPGFCGGYIGLTEPLVGLLVARGLRLLGADYMSVAPRDDPLPTHRALFDAGVVVLEGLDLRDAEPGAWELVCLPLRLAGAEAAPARAVLIRRPGTGSGGPVGAGGTG